MHDPSQVIDQHATTCKCLSPEDLFDFSLDVAEGVAAPHVQQHVDSCTACAKAYKEFCRVNTELEALQLHRTTVSRPASIGGYPITSAIAQGGMGCLWKGIDTVLERSVAIKVVRPDLADQTEYARRFLSEAKIVASLDHPNIVNVYSAGRLDDSLYLCMEYVEGETFAGYVGEHPDEIFPLFRQVLQALDYAHGEAIIHRDVKPSNIMVRSDNVVKVLDFGLARPPQEEARSTATGGITGTIAYLSPEVIRGGDASVQSDVYAAGLVLYELLSGGNPYRESSLLQTIERIKNEPLNIEGTLQRYSPDLRTFLARMTAAERSLRYATVSDVLRDFDGLPECHGPGWANKEAARTTAAPKPRHLRWLVVAVAIIAGLIGYTQFAAQETFTFDKVTLPYESADGHLACLAVLPVRNETDQTDESVQVKASTEVLIARINQVVLPLTIEIDEAARYMAGRDVMRSGTMDPLLARDLGKQGYTVTLAVSVSEEAAERIIEGKLYSSTGALLFHQTWRFTSNGSEAWREVYERVGTEFAERLQKL